ncbi:DnaJ domain-containing protein [Myxococcaceae bacterium JPH2]|nr:DnaJ domain-containing protein [Myxococcaceae bacterium JPH2]
MSEPNSIVGLGARTDHVATAPHLDTARLQLTQEEGVVLGLVGRVERIDAVLSRSSLGEARTIAALLSLRAKGAILPARIVPRAQPAPAVDAAMAEQVDLEPERKKEIIELERSLDAMDHFTVLGIAPSATAADVKQAYYTASRRFHPDRYFGKNLGSFRARMERIFRRLTEAHNVLSQDERREAYLRANPALTAPPAAPARPAVAAAPVATPPPARASAAPVATPPPARAPAAPMPPRPAPAPVPPPEPPRAEVSPLSEAESEARKAERQARLARHPYMARTHRLTELVARGKAFAAKGDFEHAYQDFHQVMTLDPKNREVPALLTEARRRHDEQRARSEVERGRELEMRGDFTAAHAAYRLATTLDGHSAEAAYLAARVGRELGQEPGEVRALAQRAVDAHPSRADYQLLLAQSLLVGGAKKLAKRHFEEVVRLDPDNAEARAALKKLRWTF